MEPVDQTKSDPENSAGSTSPPEAPNQPPKPETQSTQSIPSTLGAAPVSPAPSVEINLAKDPNLDRDPEAFGRKVEAAKLESSVGSEVESQSTIHVSPYNPDESRDATRQTITLWLLGLLCAIVSLIFVALFARGAASNFRGADFFLEIKQVLDLIVGPIITLLASAIGFYFGSKQAESKSE